MGNLVSEVMRIPQPGDTINNVHDLLKHNVTLFEIDYLFESYRDWYMDLNISEWDHVANTMVPADYSCYNGTQICAEELGTWENFIKSIRGPSSA